MKYLEIYENFNQKLKPQIGDYVICESTYYKEYHNVEVYSFLKNNIGQIISIFDKYYYVQYTDIPFTIRKYFQRYIDNREYYNVMWFEIREIINFSSNREDIEMIFTTKNFNL